MEILNQIYNTLRKQIYVLELEVESAKSLKDDRTRNILLSLIKQTQSQMFIAIEFLDAIINDADDLEELLKYYELTLAEPEA